MTFELFCIGCIGAVCVMAAAGSGGFKGGCKTAVATLAAFAFGMAIVSNMLAYTNAKHRHDREPQIVARAWR